MGCSGTAQRPHLDAPCRAAALLFPEWLLTLDNRANVHRSVPHSLMQCQSLAPTCRILYRVLHSPQPVAHSVLDLRTAGAAGHGQHGRHRVRSRLWLLGNSGSACCNASKAAAGAMRIMRAALQLRPLAGSASPQGTPARAAGWTQAPNAIEINLTPFHPTQPTQLHPAQRQPHLRCQPTCAMV